LSLGDGFSKRIGKFSWFSLLLLCKLFSLSTTTSTIQKKSNEVGTRIELSLLLSFNKYRFYVQY